ncbi:MAG TPA: putative glycoside hydrolase [Methylomirabilota bacterium]|nr:putative glycoside hydrolase [Methylomirabilota bacterium]
MKVEGTPKGSTARHLVDGGYALGLLASAVLFGYVILSPSTPHARTVPTRVAAVVSTDRTVGLGQPPVLTLESYPDLPVTRSRESALPSVARTLPPERMLARSRPAPSEHRRGRPAPLEPLAPVEWPPSPAGEGVTWPEKVTGRVLDQDGNPLAGASVVLAGRELRADAEGAFTLTPAAGSAPMIVKLPGYDRLVVAPRREPVEAVLRPRAAKAAYLTYFGIADRGIRGRVLDLLTRTELNAVVIDVKGDRGWIPYRTEVPSAIAAGAQGPVIIRDFEGMIADLRARGVYTIARVVTFKDNVLATARPDLAIVDTRTGKPWVDNEKLAWVDPFREEVWAYNIEVAREAARKGFDEVQFDYVRFPTDGKLGAARYAKPNSKQTRLPAIAAFLERARRELGPMGVYVAADVFGYTAFNDNDTDIGQRVEEMAPHLDYICPMVYPSGYHVGIPGYRNPVANPYAVVHESVRLIRKRAEGTQVRVRPWLQDFKDYAFDRRVFGVTEIRAQIKGSDDAGGAGWMLWNPRNAYTGAALLPESPLAAR